MGLLDNVLGNAGEADPEKLQEEFAQVLVADEKVTRAYQVFRDSFIFTDRRLILVDKQGLTGKKVAYYSIPYKSITHFAVETVGHFDRDAELKIWLRGSAGPIEKQFNKQVNIYEVQQTLAHYVFHS